MAKAEVFFAQPVDGIPSDLVRENLRQFEALTKDLPVVVVAPYLQDLRSRHRRVLTRSVACEIIARDYGAVQSADILVADFSNEERVPIGMVFEMVHASRGGKRIIVYAGDAEVANRVWIVGTADVICATWRDVRLAIEQFLDDVQKRQDGPAECRD